MGDAHKLEVAQFPAGGVQADKPAQFLVHKNGAKGNLDGKVSGENFTPRREPVSSGHFLKITYARITTNVRIDTRS